MKLPCPTPRSRLWPATALASLLTAAGCGAAEDRSVLDDAPQDTGGETDGETLEPPGLPLTGGQTGSETLPACEVLRESDVDDSETTLLGFSAESLLAPLSDELSGDFRWRDGAVSPSVLRVSRGAGSARVRELSVFAPPDAGAPSAEEAARCASLLQVPVVMHLASSDDRIDDSFELELIARAVDDAVSTRTW
jgi:hypothetical protein